MSGGLGWRAADMVILLLDPMVDAGSLRAHGRPRRAPLATERPHRRPVSGRGVASLVQARNRPVHALRSPVRPATGISHMRTRRSNLAVLAAGLATAAAGLPAAAQQPAYPVKSMRMVAP
ncbi:MAG: hypothetical protein ACK559_08590, partial [bacterium]